MYKVKTGGDRGVAGIVFLILLAIVAFGIFIWLLSKR